MTAVVHRPLDQEFVANAALAKVNGLLAAQNLPAGYAVFPSIRLSSSAIARAWILDGWCSHERRATDGACALMAVRRSIGDLGGDRLHIFQPGVEIAPGIGTVAAFGHTPDMTMVTARSQGQSLM